MTENTGFQLGTIGALTLSVVSSVSIVICNKALMSTLHFIFDDKAGNHPMYGIVGNSFPKQEFQLNILGSALSLLAVVTTCIAQIVSSTQLLHQSCPYQAMTLLIFGPFLDWLLTNQNGFSFNYTPKLLFFIVPICLISVSVNFSTFLVIGKTSPTR